MPWVLVRTKAEDYNKWKTVFDEDSSNRKEKMGSKGGYLFGNADDPNELVILFEWDNMEKARQFVQSADLRQTIQRSGVSDQPDVCFLDELERVSV